MTKHITVDVSKLRPGSMYTLDDTAWVEAKHPRGQADNKGQFAKVAGGTKKKALYAKMTTPKGHPGLHSIYEANVSLNKIQAIGQGSKGSDADKIEKMKKYLVYNSPGSAIGQHVKAWVNHLEGHDKWSPPTDWTYGAKPDGSNVSTKAKPAKEVKPQIKVKPIPVQSASVAKTKTVPSIEKYQQYDNHNNWVQAIGEADASTFFKLNALKNAVQDGALNSSATTLANDWILYLQANPPYAAGNGSIPSPKPPAPGDNTPETVTAPAPVTPKPAAQKSGDYTPVIGDTGMSLQSAKYVAAFPDDASDEQLTKAQNTLLNAALTASDVDPAWEASANKIGALLKSKAKASPPEPKPSSIPKYAPVYESPNKNVPLAIADVQSKTYESVNQAFIKQAGLAQNGEAYLEKLGQKTISALQSYSGSTYTSVNQKFRDGDIFSDYEQGVVDGIDAFLQKEESRLSRDVLVFRGTTLPPKQLAAIESGLKSGKIVTCYNSGYNSTSLSHTKAFGFGQHRFAIQIRAGQHGVYMNHGCTSHTSEFEFLVRRGAPMRITGKTVVDGQTIYNAVIGEVLT